MNRLAMCVAAIAALIAAPAFAADMPVQAPPPAPKPVYSWTGWYVGGNVGYSWGDAKTDLNGEGVAASPNGIPAPPFLFPFPIQFTGGSDTVRLKGAIGGPQVGYNYQVNSLWVLGLESDFQIFRRTGKQQLCGSVLKRGMQCWGVWRRCQLLCRGRHAQRHRDNDIYIQN